MDNNQLNQENFKTQNTITEIYEPKIKRRHFYFFIFLLDFVGFFKFPLIFNSVHANRGEFDGLPQFFIFIFADIIFTILAIISYEILIKKEENGSKYNPSNHKNTYIFILITSILIFFIALISAVIYLIPLLKNYQTFKLLELVKNSKYTYWGYLPGMYIHNFLNSNYLILRYILIILSGHLIYLTIKSYNIARVYIFWIISFIVISQLFFNLDVFSKTYITYKNNVTSIVNMTNGILEYEKIISTNNPSLCSTINDKTAQFNCENYFYQISKDKPSSN